MASFLASTWCSSFWKLNDAPQALPEHQGAARLPVACGAQLPALSSSLPFEILSI